MLQYTMIYTKEDERLIIKWYILKYPSPLHIVVEIHTITETEFCCAQDRPWAETHKAVD